MNGPEKRKGKRYYPPTRLPDDWSPALIPDPIQREEYEHFAAFQMTPERILDRLGIPLQTALKWCNNERARRSRAARREQTPV